MTSCHVTVTNQQQAENLTDCETIDIQDATGTLNFTNLERTLTITGQQIPELMAMNFPKLGSFGSLQLSDVASLTAMTFPMLEPSDLRISPDGFSGRGSIYNINITGAPNLQSISWNVTFFGSIVMWDISEFSDFGSDLIQEAVQCRINTCHRFDSLTAVTDLHIYGARQCYYSLDRLSSVGNLILENGGSAHLTTLTESGGAVTPVRVNDSMVLESASADGIYENRELDLGLISTIAKDLTAKSNSDININFDGLTDVGANFAVFNNTNCEFKFGHISSVSNLMVFNNTNCTFDFGQVESATNLSFYENVETVLPLFPRLENVGNVRLQGQLDTSNGPNIFPALRLASGNVVIEASNSDFNCSKLVSQWRDNVIHTLMCNGTDNGTETASSIQNGPATSSPRLRTPALAGIGVAAGLVGLALVGAVIWLCLRLVRRPRTLEAAQRQAGAPLRPNETGPDDSPVYEPTTGMHEADPTAITEGLREKPDDHLPKPAAPQFELPDSQVLEMSVEEAEPRPVANHSGADGFRRSERC
ncbi:hypothetical protein F5Y17DRAFT_319365 [Xylariaceae sp. FL0594]|nr:hypothetical protein F5Y17DRAFT_319365 [Xylariaceae sp. FL0594]